MYIGIRRRLDKLGRVVIPKELRDLYKIKELDTVEIIGTDQGILITVPNFEVALHAQSEKPN